VSTDVDDQAAYSDSDWSSDSVGDDGRAHDSRMSLAPMTDSDLDTESDTTPSSGSASALSTPAPPKDQGQLFATPAMQTGVHKMLTHLQEWWDHSEGLLHAMAEKNLPCASLTKMSDQIDRMVDKSIEKLIKSVAADPAVFPIAALVGTTRDIKKYLFLKVGEVCCQGGRQDECAKMANRALVALKKFRNSAADFYDQMIAHVISGMTAAENTPAAGGGDISTPELENLLKQLQEAPARPRAGAAKDSPKAGAAKGSPKAGGDRTLPRRM
jgi:hypothetical protein